MVFDNQKNSKLSLMELSMLPLRDPVILKWQFGASTETLGWECGRYPAKANFV